MFGVLLAALHGRCTSPANMPEPAARAVEGVVLAMSHMIHSDAGMLTTPIWSANVQDMRSQFARLRRAMGDTPMAPQRLGVEVLRVIDPYLRLVSDFATDAYRVSSPAHKAACWLPAFQWILNGTRARTSLACVLEDQAAITQLIEASHGSPRDVDGTLAGFEPVPTVAPPTRVRPLPSAPPPADDQIDISIHDGLTASAHSEDDEIDVGDHFGVN